MLVIELDGSQHIGSLTDPVRNAELKQRGFEVLRFFNNDLFLQRDRVLDAIASAVEQRGAHAQR
jgi:very-short-patch-repair endonuclease